jgi:hypothetical protein
MALVRCILGKFLGVVCHCFPCIYMYFLFLSVLAPNVSGAICTHSQEHKLQRTAIGVYTGLVMLVHYIHLWLYAAVCAPEDGCKEHPKHVELK